MPIQKSTKALSRLRQLPYLTAIFVCIGVVSATTVIATEVNIANDTVGERREQYVEPDPICEPHQTVELEQVYLCVRGLSDTNLNVTHSGPLSGRRPQWNEREIRLSGGMLADAWPTGVSYIRISQNGLREPRNALVPSPVPGIMEERLGPMTFYWQDTLQFRGEHIVIRCSPTLLPAATDTLVEACNISAALSNDLVLRVYVYTGVFYDGGPGEQPDLTGPV